MDDLAVGIDFGGTKMLGAIADRDGNVLAQHRLPTPYSPTELIDDIIEMLEALEESAGRKAVGLGVGAAGLVNRDGVLVYGPNVGRVTDVDVGGEVSARRNDLRLVIENDATCATWSEARVGAGAGAREMVMVTLGTGIGSGFVSDGKIVRGAMGFAGELGHMVVEVDGIECVCRKVGCWEAYASGRALGRMGRESAAVGKAHEVLRLAGAIDDIRGEHVTTAARSGDEQARRIIDEFSWWVALGIANSITVLDPAVVVVGGGMAEDADLFLDKVQIEANEMAMGSGNRPVVPVVRATLGERAGAMGAALMTFLES